jgi:hypothetical protein
MNPQPPKSKIHVSPIALQSVLFFVAIVVGGFVFLWIFAHKEAYSSLPRLLAFASSAPAIAILNEFWKSKKQSEEFVSKRKAEVDAQFQGIRKEVREALDEAISEIRQEFNRRDLEIARLKGEVKSSTRFWQISDKFVVLQAENEQLRSRIDLLEQKLSHDQNPCD